MKPAVAASSGGEGGTMFDAFLTSKKFQEALRTAGAGYSPHARRARSS